MFKNKKQHGGKSKGGDGRIDPRSEAPSILDAYATSFPCAQNALDIFSGEWASRLPAEHAELEAGELSLCHDPRVAWGLDEIGGVSGYRVLELGPLEAGHSYMLEQRGAERVVSVESNTRSFLKCLIFKEVVGLTRTHFLLGDAIEHLRNCGERYDLVLASGILYHMRNPVELIELISKVTNRVLVWTHYFEAERINANRSIADKFPDKVDEIVHGGFRATLHRQLYTESQKETRFCGGSAEFSSWLEREPVLDCLRHFGFDQQEIEFEEPAHPNGPCFTIAASRTPR